MHLEFFFGLFLCFFANTSLSRLVVNVSDDGGIFHLLQILLTCLGKVLFSLASPFLHLALHFHLHAFELLPLLLLLLTHAALLLVNLASPSHVILRLRQQILTLPGLDGGASQVVLHAVALHGQVLEVLVRQA
jgi:hypothetical protein